MDALSLKPKILSQLVHPIVLQVRHPGMAPQGIHNIPFRNRPFLHKQMVENIVKLLVVSQMRQTDELSQDKHPMGH